MVIITIETTVETSNRFNTHTHSAMAENLNWAAFIKSMPITPNVKYSIRVLSIVKPTNWNQYLKTQEFN